MQKITKTCKHCKSVFTITYYVRVDDDKDATDVCNRCWNKRVSNYWTSTRDVLKDNHKSNEKNYSDSLASYLESKNKKASKPKSGIAIYLDNLIPESQLKKADKPKKDKDKDKKNKDKKDKDKKGSVVAAPVVNTPNIPWLTNHSNGNKEPMLSPSLEIRVGSLLNKLKGA